MSDRRKVIKSIVIFGFMFLILNTAAVSAIAPPPPPGGRFYTVDGYVKSESGVALRAYVKLYVESMDYVKATYSSSSTGYFSFRVYQGHAPDWWQVRVTKSSYEEKRVTAYGGIITNFGVINLVYVPPSPPAEPVIDQVHVTGQGLTDYAVEYDITWDTSTQYEMKFYWSQDSTIDEDDLWDIQIDGATHYEEISLPMTWTDSEYWFQIAARSKNAGGWGSTEIYGPQSVDLKYYPTDDATIDESQPDSTFNDGDIMVVNTYDNGLYNQYGILKFSIPNFNNVKSAELKMWSHSNAEDGHGTIFAIRMTDTEWQEESVSWNWFQGVTSGGEPYLDKDATSNVGGWDNWDVTLAVQTSGETRIRLSATGNPLDGDIYGSYYYSKNYWEQEKWPHLVVEYWGVPEDPPHKQFIDDEFALRTPDIYNWESGIWTHTAQNNPANTLALNPNTPVPNQNDPISGALHYWEAPAETINMWSGHLLEQDGLYMEGSFFFIAEVRIIYTPARVNQKIGLSLFNQADPVAEVWHIRHESSWVPPTGGTHYELFGSVTDGSTTDSSSVFRDETMVTYVLIMERTMDGYINVGYVKADFYGEYSLLSYELLARIYNPEPITLVRLSMLYEGDNVGSNADVDMMCFSVRECKSLSLADPHMLRNPFDTPIQEYDFDYNLNEVTELSHWRDFDMSLPNENGYLFDETEDDAIDNSWRASVDSNHWYLRQPLVESSAFSFGAVEDQSLAFTYLARRDYSWVKVRAVILYRAEGELYNRAVVGEWTHLPDDDNWYQISVITNSPLPSSIDYLEVMMEGASVYNYNPSDDFTVYVDLARLTIVQNTVTNNIIIGDCALSFGLGIAPADGGGGEYIIDFMPSVILQTGQDCHVTAIEYIVEVNHGDVDLDTIVEGNNEGIFQPQQGEPDGVRHELDKHYVSFIKGVAKWVPRVLLYAANIGGPFAWMITDPIGGTASQAIDSYQRTTVEENSQASIDDPIELVIDYGAQVETLVTSLELGWELDTPITFPHVATTFIVHWLDSAGQTQTTSHTIMLSFNYLGT